MARKAIDKESILQAASGIADEKGLASVTLKELADRLGIKTPSLYNHLDGLPGLYNAMALHGLTWLCRDMTGAAAGLSGKNAMMAIGKAYLQFARNHPGFYEATQSVNKWLDDEVSQASEAVLALVAKVLSALPVSETDLTHVIRMFRSMMHGFASLERQQGFGNPVGVEQSFEASMDILLEGIEAKYGGIL